MRTATGAGGGEASKSTLGERGGMPPHRKQWAVNGFFFVGKKASSPHFSFLAGLPRRCLSRPGHPRAGAFRDGLGSARCSACSRWVRSRGPQATGKARLSVPSHQIR